MNAARNLPPEAVGPPGNVPVRTTKPRSAETLDFVREINELRAENQTLRDIVRKALADIETDDADLAYIRLRATCDAEDDGDLSVLFATVNDGSVVTDDPKEVVTPSPARRRATWLRVDELRLLDHWCRTLREAFAAPVYLVGSTLRGPGWRDVDVRVVLPDDRYAHVPMRLSDLNLALSIWGQRATGLPVDCQVQSESEHRAHTGPVNPRPHPDRPFVYPPTSPGAPT